LSHIRPQVIKVPVHLPPPPRKVVKARGTSDHDVWRMYDMYVHMRVSLPWWYPHMVCLLWKISFKWMIWGYPYFSKPPCDELFLIFFPTCSNLMQSKSSWN
jgi:hypothetical protein